MTCTRCNGSGQLEDTVYNRAINKSPTAQKCTQCKGSGKYCPDCDGSGKCDLCGGTGTFKNSTTIGGLYGTCTKCYGYCYCFVCKGKPPECRLCNGTGYIDPEDNYNFDYNL